MSDNPVSNVKRVDPQALQAAQGQQQASQVVKDTGKVDSVVSKESESVAKQYQSATDLSSSVNRETNLKFQVDVKTHKVTVMIMDKDTNKVISTIPPDKIKDVPPGDLYQYLA